MRVLLIAGHETTAAALGLTLHHLATHPDDLRRLRDEPGPDPDRRRGVPPPLVPR